MKRLKIGINGFGRIGRTIFRILQEQDLFDVAVINDVNPDVASLAYQLRYDSVRGGFPGKIVVGEGKLTINDRDIDVYHRANIVDVPWSDRVDVLIDSSGVRENIAAISTTALCCESDGHYIHTHAVHAAYPERRRDLTPSIAESVKTVVFGANEAEFAPARDRLISASICDTIALGPIIKLIEDAYGIESGSLTTLHPWLGDQNLMDGNPDPRRTNDNMHSHYSLARAAVNNLIPKSTTAVRAADAVFPLLSEKIESFSYRVPTDVVASAVLNLALTKPADQADLIEKFYQ
ncbi:MAG TPA: glyceraldehyde 3-phosphate dehydrogenase NAD-binding domain-containing protein, partial [Methylobacter sp.]